MEYIRASFIVTCTNSAIETQKVIESYTSTTSDNNLVGMLGGIASVVFPDLGGDISEESYKRELLQRIEKYGAHIADPVELGNGKFFKIDVLIPSEALDWDRDGVPHLLVRFAGNIFRTTEVDGIKWVDLSFPPGYIERYSWARPSHGISGIKNFLRISNTEETPLIGATLQPNIGLTPDECGIMAANVVKWGAQVVIEDEMLNDLPIAHLSDRLDKVSARLSTLKKNSIYLLNVMGWSDFIRDELPYKIKELNSKYSNVKMGVLLCPVYGGFDLIRKFRRTANCPIFSHYYAISLFIRNPNFGISTKVLSILSAMSGADFVYVGHVTGRHISESPLSLAYAAKELRKLNVYPAISGGIKPENVLANLRSLGLDTLIQSASGIFGHPMGPKAGLESLNKMITLCKEYCIKCNHETIEECNGFADLLSRSPELQVIFRNRLPIISPPKT